MRIILLKPKGPDYQSKQEQQKFWIENCTGQTRPWRSQKQNGTRKRTAPRIRRESVRVPGLLPPDPREAADVAAVPAVAEHPPPHRRRTQHTAQARSQLSLPLLSLSRSRDCSVVGWLQRLALAP